VLSLFGFLAVGLAGAGPAMAADPTMAPLVPGQHLYDNGKLLSATSVKTAETLASDIEAEGGGRVVVYTAASDTDLPGNDTLASRWFVDGLLLTATSDGFGQLTVGATLKGKLTADQASFVADNSSNGPATPESWITSTLARVHGFLSGTYVFDGAGILDGTGKQKAEAAAKDLSGKIGAPVYIDIAVGGDSAETAAFFNGAGLSDTFSKSYVIALAVSDKQIGGYIDSGERPVERRRPLERDCSERGRPGRAAGGDRRHTAAASDQFRHDPRDHLHRRGGPPLARHAIHHRAVADPQADRRNGAHQGRPAR
jgi:hypothetical protein